MKMGLQILSANTQPAKKGKELNIHKQLTTLLDGNTGLSQTNTKRFDHNTAVMFSGNRMSTKETIVFPFKSSRNE